MGAHLFVSLFSNFPTLDLGKHMPLYNYILFVCIGQPFCLYCIRNTGQHWVETMLAKQKGRHLGIYYIHTKMPTLTPGQPPGLRNR